MFPRHVNSVQWEQAIGYARQACARIFRDGGTPATALGAFGLSEPVRPAGAPRSIASPMPCAPAAAQSSLRRRPHADTPAQRTSAA